MTKWLKVSQEENSIEIKVDSGTFYASKDSEDLLPRYATVDVSRGLHIHYLHRGNLAIESNLSIEPLVADFAPFL